MEKPFNSSTRLQFAPLFVSGSPFCGVFIRERRFPVKPHRSIHDDRNVPARAQELSRKSDRAI